MSIGNEVRQLIKKARAADGGPRYAGSVKVQDKGDAAYGCIPQELIQHENIEKGDTIERYIDFEARAVVMFMPKDSESDS